MKKKPFSQNNLSGFAPETHWDLILMFVAILVIVIAGYFSYVYITLNKHIQAIATETANTDNASGKDELALKKIINMESVIQGYRDRDLIYHTRLNALISKVPAPIATTTPATSTVVASSSVR
ncbi:MAG: hypothetical protein RJB39_264 [Candidatus Parcubacteria bacterium]|jgi:hypothetical protein